MSSEQIFSIKDKVFVKRRGYPAWPALISGIKTNNDSQPIYDVYFYGTGDYSECKSEVLSLYEENKNKLGKPRGKLRKFKKFVEALVQIENDAKSDFQSKKNVGVDVKEFMPTISTKSLDRELSLENKSKNVNKIELNLKNETKLINETSLLKGKKVIKSRKRVSNSIDLKRKLSDVKHEEVPKKFKTSRIIMPTEDQPIVLLEPLNDIFLERKMNEKQNSEAADKNLAAHQRNSKIFNTTKSVLESSDVSLNVCKTTESLEMNDSVVSSNKTFSDSGRVSRFGRKIKSNRLSNHKIVTKAPKHLKEKDLKTLKTHNSSNDETNDFFKQNIKTRGSNTKARNSLKSNAMSIPCLLDNASQTICQVNNNRHEKIPPIDLNQNAMGSFSNVEVEWTKMESNKAGQISLLLTEINLLDYVNKLCSALSINYTKLNYEIALKSLEQISELQFNALMLKKHRCIVDKITKVTRYVGDVNNWCLSNQETIEHVNKANQIRCKAQMVLNKCKSLFTVPNGQTFQEVYNKEVDLFISKTQHLTNDQIYSCTSDKMFI